MAEGGGNDTSRKELTTNNVRLLLEDKGFRFKDHLGALAGRLQPSLDERNRLSHQAFISSDYRTPLEECVDYWLRNSHEPSWEKLIPIIATVDKAAARYMREYLGLEQVPEEGTILELLSESELKQMGPLPVDLLSKLEAEGIRLPDESEVLRNWKELIEGIRQDLKDDEQKTIKFAKVLSHYKDTVSLGRKIILKDCPPPSQIILSPTFERTFEDVNCIFATLMDNVNSKMLPCLPEFSKFKKYVSRIPDMGLKIKDCQNNEEILNVIEEGSGFINVVKFQRIAERYNCEEVLQDISKYNDEIDKLCEDIRNKLKTRLTNSPFIDEPLKCERLEFALQWEPGQDTFKGIKAILSKAFEDIADYVIVICVDDGSVAVLCYIPHSLVPLAVYKAKKNMASLEKLGLIRMTIGYYTVLEEKAKELIEEEEAVIKEIEQETPVEIDESTLIKEELSQVKEQLEKTTERCTQLEEDRKSYSQLTGDQLTGQLIDRLSEQEKKVSSSKTSIDKLVNEKEILLKEQEKYKEKSRELSEQLLTKTNELKSVTSHNETLLSEKDEVIADQKEEIIQFKEDLQKAQDEIHKRDKLVEESAYEIKSLEEQLKKELEEARDHIELLKGEKDHYKKMWRVQLLENEKLTREKDSLSEKLKHQLPTLHDDWRESHTPPLQIIMNEFDRHKTSNDHWFSPSFLSHPGGYRMCLKVRPNGEEEGRGTHVSVSVHLMVGEFDDNLAWPFKGRVTVALLNRKFKGKDVMQEIVLDESSSQEARQRVFNGIPIQTGIASFHGQGGVTFIPQEELYYNAQNNTEYLRKDSIILNIISVDVDFGAREIIPASLPINTQAVVEFKIDKFISRKGKNSECISEPFYSHENGYKFQLLVYPNGRGKYKGKSVSVFVHLMRGENDSKLAFPFRGELLTQIVNFRKDQNHVEKAIMFNEATDPDGKYGARVSRMSMLTSGRSIQGYGFPNFVSHEYLEFSQDRETQYLNDDGSILLRIMSIKVY